MALRMLKLNDELETVNTRMSEINEELENLDKTEHSFEKRYQEVKDNDEELEVLFEQDKELEQRKTDLNNELAELEERLKEIEVERKECDKGEKVTVKEEANNKLETRDVLNNYLHKKDLQKEEVRAAGFVSDDGQVLIPEEIVYQPIDEVYTEQDLEQYINIVSVSTATGKYPIMERTSEIMHTVEELAKNPRLANPTFEEIHWSVDTYRGYIPISQESIEDSAVDLLALISRHILRIVLNTTNKLVAPIMQNYQSAIAKNLDDLKKLDNVLLDPAYNRTFYMSQSMFNYIDTLKDSHGDYIFQVDISSPSKKTLFGYPVVRMRDTLIGQYNGAMVCFFGDLRAAVTKFNRRTISAQWNDNDLFAQNIQTGFRADYEACDKKAGYYVLFAPAERDIEIKTSDEQTPETVEGVTADITVADNIATIKYTGLTGQVITYSLKDSKGAVVAEMPGRFTTERTEDQITVNFYQDMVKGDYTLEAKVLDSKKYKCIKSVKLAISQKSDEASKILNGTPIVIANV